MTDATVTFDLFNALKVPFDARRTKIWLTFNTDDGWIVDENGDIRMDAGTATITDAGLVTLTGIPVPSADTNPTDFQVKVHFDAPFVLPGVRGLQRKSGDFGWMTVTADADLTDLIAEQYVPPTWQSEFMVDAQALLDQQIALSGIDDTDSAIAYSIEYGEETPTALAVPIDESARETIAGRVSSDRLPLSGFSPTITETTLVNAATSPQTWNANPTFETFDGKKYAFRDSNTHGTEGAAGQKITGQISTDDAATWSADFNPFRDAALCNNPISSSTVEWQPNLVVNGDQLWCSWRGDAGYVSILNAGAGQKWTNYQIEFKGLAMRLSSTITLTPSGGWSIHASFDGQTDWLPFPGQPLVTRDGETFALPMTLVSAAIDPSAPSTAPTFYKQMKWTIVAQTSDNGTTWTVSDPVQPAFGSYSAVAWEAVLSEAANGDWYLWSRNNVTAVANNHTILSAVSRNRGLVFSPPTYVDLMVPVSRGTIQRLTDQRWVMAHCDHPQNDTSSPESGSAVGRRNASLFMSRRGTDDYAPGLGVAGASLNQQYPWVHVNGGKVYVIFAEDLPAGGRSMRLNIVQDAPLDDTLAYVYPRRYSEIVASTAPTRLTTPNVGLLFSSTQYATAASALASSTDITFAEWFSPSGTAVQILTDLRPSAGTSAPPSLYTDGVRFGSLLLAHGVASSINTPTLVGAALNATAGSVRFNVFTGAVLTQVTAYLKAMTVSGTPAAGDTVTVDGTVLTWRVSASLTTEVTIGGTTAASATNLAAALIANGKKAVVYGSSSKVLTARSDQATFSISYSGTAVTTDSAIPITGSVAPRFGYKIPSSSTAVGFGGVIYDGRIYRSALTDANLLSIYHEWNTALGLAAIAGTQTAPAAADVRLIGTSTSTDFPDIDVTPGTARIVSGALVITGESTANVEQPYDKTTTAIRFQLDAAPTGVERYTIATLGGASNPVLVQLHGESPGTVYLNGATTGITFADTTRENMIEINTTSGSASIGIVSAAVPGPIRLDLGGPQPAGKVIRFNLAGSSVADGRLALPSATARDLNAHIANVSNPHAVTKTQVGLANVDNISDANKPVSTAQQAALDAKVSIGEVVRSKLKVGRYYLPPNMINSAPAAPTKDTAYAVPFGIPRDCTLDRIGVYVSGAGAAGAVFHLGIYADDGTGYPGALLVDAGTVDAAAATTAREITISQVVTKQLVWLVLAEQVAATAATVPCYNGSSPAVGYTDLSNAVQGNARAYAISGVSGLLPALWSSGTEVLGNRAPIFTLRASA